MIVCGFVDNVASKLECHTGSNVYRLDSTLTLKQKYRVDGILARALNIITNYTTKGTLHLTKIVTIVQEPYCNFKPASSGRSSIAVWQPYMYP